MPRTDTLIVGAGQAGLALSRELTLAGRDHVLVERGRVGERWRTGRWDSLTLLTPNWLSRLPGDAPIADPHAFMTRDELIARLGAYAASFAAPVIGRTRVHAVRRRGGAFHVETDGGTWRAEGVVVATGAADRLRLPESAAAVPRGVLSLHAAAYRSPGALPDGGVLVVGAGPTGQQLALELRRAGREVVLAAGRHARMIRRHRGIDAWTWLGRIGELERTIDEVRDPAAARRAASLVLTGARGGERLDLGVLRDAGVTLAGRLLGWAGSRARFAADLPESARAADARMRRLLARFDAQAGSPSAWPAALDLAPGPAELDLRPAGIGTVLWATGFGRRYDWLPDGATDADGELVHRRGVTRVPGLYALGLPFQHRRTSHMIGGVGADAAHIAAVITGARRRATAIAA
ncbi:NAD(P)-binding domain-containing protein [Capillimicrobium parvum]|uniref:Oxidoreductase CzcO n=1 Tax=Capillimicrobium parvum TaxID=2884022 RepID=A0A9E6XWR0_9ACTN|nr:NAD(P)-binding domain-containing protein [Capillimicrobium parvum]UGS35212.1 putative oxidoreductase CzcO [Capillimicrobium parvum]